MKTIRAKLVELLKKLRAQLEGPPEPRPTATRTQRDVESWHNEGGH